MSRTTTSVARIWRGSTRAARADQYIEFLVERAVPDYRQTPGNLDVKLLVRIDGERADFLFLTLWESEAAIRNFAGADITRAKYYPEDPEFLLELVPEVEHYDVIGWPAAR